MGTTTAQSGYAPVNGLRMDDEIHGAGDPLLVLHGAYMTIGTMAFDGGAPMHWDAIFRIASVTKRITAAAAMILVEECGLRTGRPGRAVAAGIGRPHRAARD